MFNYHEMIKSLENKINKIHFGEDILDVTSCKGYRLAYLNNIRDFSFASLFGGIFKKVEKAQCVDGHEAPVMECACGFYSFKNFNNALKEKKRYFRQAVILQVENFGEIVEHEIGFRSSEQEVTSLYLKSKCRKFFCYEESHSLLHSEGRLRELCKKHAQFFDPEKYSILSFSQILDMHNIEVKAVL